MSLGIAIPSSRSDFASGVAGVTGHMALQQRGGLHLPQPVIIQSAGLLA
jgi:hypothetical protein